MTLIKGWQKWYKFWSIQLGMIGTAITSVLVAYPNLAIDLWAIMPQEFKDLIPASSMPLIGVVIFIVSMASKFVVQSKLHEEDQTNDPS